ncbi:MAG TPA: hypothetical protein VGG75_19560 [Trebonia sp.]|jgi:hypothetical protein
MAAGFTDDGLGALDAALAKHVEGGEVPGLVALAARNGQAHRRRRGHAPHPGRGDGA